MPAPPTDPHDPNPWQQPGNSTPTDTPPAPTHKVQRKAVVACGCGLYRHNFRDITPTQAALNHAKLTGHTCELKVVYRVKK